MVSRMKITNIANDRDKQGYFYSSEIYHPTTHHLAVEPWIAGYCLKLDSEIEIPTHCYFSEKDYMDALKANRIIDFISPEPQKEVVIEQKAPEEKPTEKTFVFSEKLTEMGNKTIEDIVFSTEDEVDLIAKKLEQIEKIEANDAADFSEKFKETIATVKEAATIIGKSIEKEVQQVKSPIKPYNFNKKAKK